MALPRFAAALALALGLLHPCWAQDTQVVTLPAPPPGATSQPSSHAVAAVSSVPAAAAVPAGGLLWKATSATATVYLAGSLHFGSQDMYPLPQAMESAFEASSVLVVELDPSAVSQASVLNLMATSAMYPPGDTLWNHVSERTRSHFPAFAAGLGLNAEMLARMKPWAVSFMLAGPTMQAAGMRPDLGIDMHFLGKARGVKRVEELETAQQQIRAFLDVPEREHAQALEEAVTEPERGRQILRTMKAAWLKGDAAAIEALLSEEFRDAPETRRLLLDDRNVRMAAAVERYLQGSEPCFVVVGAGHLVGKGGIVSRLIEKGFSVKRVAPAN
jgi:uncharacterized protein YbaP (TraB family)